MKKISEITVKVTYAVTLNDVEVEDETLASLERCMDAWTVTNDKMTSNKSFYKASDWINNNIFEADAHDWEYEVDLELDEENHSMNIISNDVVINYIEPSTIEPYGDSSIPTAYEVSITFYGLTYLMKFTVEDMRGFCEGLILACAKCEGPAELFDSIETYFENNRHNAGLLLRNIKAAWEKDYRNDGMYDYLGIKNSESEERDE